MLIGKEEILTYLELRTMTHLFNQINYLPGNLILLFTYGLSKKLNIRIVFIISIIFLIIGTVKSTYSTAVEQLTGITLPDYLGFRNGLFYAFPYFTLGMAVAKTDSKYTD